MSNPMLPLAGTRVVDFGQLTAGANMAAMLADLGADVIKVESASYFDLFRYSKREPGMDWWNKSPYFKFTNRNKRSLAIDLKHPKGHELAFELMCRSDIVVENFRRGVLDGLGLGPAAVAARNPAIVFASVSSQGETGPNRMHRTYGCTLDAMGGIAALTGYAGERPAITGAELNYPDQVVSLLAAGFVISALREVRRTGKGGHLDIAQREIVSFLIGEEIAAASSGASGAHEARRGNDDGMALLQDCCPAADGHWLAVSVENEREAAALERLIGPAPDRREALCGWVAARSSNDAAKTLRRAGVVAWPVLDGRDLLAAPDRVGCSLKHGDDGMLYKGMPYVLEGLPFVIRRPAPDLGQDTGDILREILEKSDADIASLDADGVTNDIPKEAA